LVLGVQFSFGLTPSAVNLLLIAAIRDGAWRSVQPSRSGSGERNRQLFPSGERQLRATMDGV
jgi:hypothetical protein